MRGSVGTAVGKDRFWAMFKGRASLGKPEFFDADMYMFHVTGFRPGRGVLTEPVKPAHGARLDVWKTDPADRRRIPALDGGGACSAPRISR